MCGLFGVATPSGLTVSDLERAASSRDTLVHRGPNGSGEWHNDVVYLGHRRLSIIDTTDAGRQPMSDSGAVVTVNGEVFNFRSLRRELVSRGWHFVSQSDSEVILRGYLEWGIDGLLNRLEGMYAVVIFDSIIQRLFAFTDRVGIKPFIYRFDGKALSWASELKAIRHYVGNDALKVLPEAAVDFLAYRYLPAPRTIYRDVFKLPAAHLLEFDVKEMRLTTRRYWELPMKQDGGDNKVYRDRLLELLAQSVSDQLVSDVPLGLLLSGGTDSSAIAALAAREVPQIQSFSMGFSSQHRDETPYAQVMAEHAGTLHHVRYLNYEDMHDFPVRMAEWFDEPFGDTSCVPTYRVCEFASEHVTVALSGDGGDELFGGYRWYERYDRASVETRFMPFRSPRGIEFPSIVPCRRELRQASFSDPVWRYAHIRGSLPARRLEQWKEALGVPADYDPLWAYRQHFYPELSPRRAAQVMDFHTFLPDDVMTKVDRVSMAVSIECRPPLLSTGLIEFAFSLPDSFVYADGQLKGGFRKTLEPLLPETILAHRKQGFGVPNDGWMRKIIGDAGSWQEALILPYIDGVASPKLS